MMCPCCDKGVGIKMKLLRWPVPITDGRGNVTKVSHLFDVMKCDHCGMRWWKYA